MCSFQNCILLYVSITVLPFVASAKSPSKEIIDDWKSLESEFAIVNGTIIEVIDGVKRVQYDFALQGQLGKSETGEGVRLFDNIHTFNLARSDSRTTKWTLANVSERKTDELVGNMRTYVRKSTSIGNVGLLDMLDSNLYEFGDWIESDSKTSTTINFLAPDPKLFDVVEVDFDKSNRHRVMKAIGSKLYPQGKRFTEYSYYYRDSNLPEKVVVVFSGAGSPATLEYRYSGVSTSPKADREFTLQHFGLPDYVEPRRKTGISVFVLCGCFLICSTLAYFYLRRKA